MNAGDKKLSSTHIMFGIACIIQGSSFLTSFILGISKQDTWIIVCTGLGVSILISFIYIELIRKFPNQTLIQIHGTVYGKELGRVISLLYFVFFISICALNSDDVVGFIGSFLLPETPSIVIVSFFMFFCIWAVRKGINNLLRISVILSVYVSSMIVISFFMQIKNIELSNFLPIASLPPSNYIQATHTLTSIPYLEIIVFLMLFPQMQNQSDAKGTIFGGLMLGAAILLLVIIRNIGMLGSSLTLFTNPSYISLRLINIGEVLTRMEVLFAINLMILLFFKVSVFLYATTMTVKQIFGLNHYDFLVTPIGALIVLYTLIIFNNSAEHAMWGSTTGAIFGSFFQILLPIITVIVAIVRYPQKENTIMN